MILFYASFFAGVIVMYEGIAQISPIYVRVARTLGATDGEIFRKVIMPLAVPHMLTALRVALGVAWATLVASELIAAQQGLGALIQNAAVVLPARHHLRRASSASASSRSRWTWRCAPSAGGWSRGRSGSHERLAPAHRLRPRRRSSFRRATAARCASSTTSPTRSATASSSRSSVRRAAARPR